MKANKDLIELFLAAVGLVVVAVSTYYAYQTVRVSRDTVALQRESAEADRRARRPYLRLQRMELTRLDSPWMIASPELQSLNGWKLPPGEGKRLELEFSNGGQRSASGIHVISSAWWLRGGKREPGVAVPSMTCPTSVANAIEPGDSFSVGCPVYTPQHDSVAVTITYEDPEGGGREFCQFLALEIDHEGRVQHADQIAAVQIHSLASSTKGAGCGDLHVPAWFERAKIRPDPQPTPAKAR